MSILNLLIKKKVKSKIINFDFKKLENKSLKNIGMMIKNAEEVWLNFYLLIILIILLK